MKAIILSAGAGSRLLPLTETMPKCLVTVGRRAILDHQIDALAASGIDHAVIVGGYRIAQIADHLAARTTAIETELVFNPFWSVASSIGSVWAARAHLDTPFCLMNGDTVFDRAILRDAIRRVPERPALVVEPIAHADTDDMRVSVRDGRVTAVGKDLDDEATTHRSLGIVLSPGGPEYPHALQAVIAGSDGIHAYHHAIVALLAGTTGVDAIARHDGVWQEVDRPEDIDRWQATHIARAAE